MSTCVLRFIPEEPTFVPAEEAVKQAREQLGRAAGKPAVARVTEGLAFVDPGENLEAVGCPACGSGLELAWWQERMQGASSGGFSELQVAVPCCGAETSLHDLDYTAPAGFARFVLEVEDPAVDPEAVEGDELEGTLGCFLRRIVARY